MRGDPAGTAFTFIVALAIVVALLLAALLAPCWVFSPLPATQTPARCLQQFVRGGE